MNPNEERAMDEATRQRLGKANGAGIEVPDYMADSWAEGENADVFPDPVDRATAIANSALWDAREQEPDATGARIARRVALYLEAAGALADPTLQDPSGQEDDDVE